MAEESRKDKFINYIYSKLSKVKPVTPENIYVYYVPLAGALSYSAFSVTVFIPDVSSRVKIPSKNADDGSNTMLFSRNSLAVANSLLFNSHLGSGLYLYNRSHMQKAPIYYRIMYSVYGALLFNFGSVLLWAVTRTLLPESNTIRTVFALSTSFCMLTIGKEYLDFVDSGNSANTPSSEQFSPPGL